MSVSGTLCFSKIFFCYCLPIIHIHNFKFFLQMHFISMAIILRIPRTFSWWFMISACYSGKNSANEESEFWSWLWPPPAVGAGSHHLLSWPYFSHYWNRSLYFLQLYLSGLDESPLRSETQKRKWTEVMNQSIFLRLSQSSILNNVQHMQTVHYIKRSLEIRESDDQIENTH